MCLLMAESRRYLPLQQLDIVQILQEAQHRWLRPAEICEILRNYQNFHLTSDPPVQPPAGSLFLFDRKALRYFRKDGHRWRKKKDGKTVREAHEKLKAGSVDVLHCYYAHGEDNENFQRRSYWMLDGKLEHIVLVHYREVKEGYKSSISRLLPYPESQVGNAQANTDVCFTQATSRSLSGHSLFGSSPSKLDWSSQTLPSEVEDVGSRDDPGTSYHTQPTYNSVSQNATLLGHNLAGFPESSSNFKSSWLSGSKFNHASGPLACAGVQSSSGNADNASDSSFTADKKFVMGEHAGDDFIPNNETGTKLDGDSKVQDNVTCRDQLVTGLEAHAITTPSTRTVRDVSGPPVDSTPQIERKCEDSVANNCEPGELKKLDSFGRWMDKEIGVDCDDSLMASDSGNYWSTIDANNDDKEVSSLSNHMQLDIDSLGPSLSQEQLFSIRDFSPDWTYSGGETKVLVIGTFLGIKQDSENTTWGCMFGEVEVSAEVLTPNVIRCQAPNHGPGRVPFYITRSNRLACSEVREFEYREKPEPYSMAVKNAPEEETRLQTRLAKLLYVDLERNWLNCSVEDCHMCKIGTAIYSRATERRSDWERVEKTCITRDLLLESLLKDRLCEWLVCIVHEGGKGPHVLDEEGLGVVHLAASLGYDWAMSLIVASGVSPNYRDARGRAALHWASYFGREETVIELVRLGAAAGAVDDPTAVYPGGQTAADLASSRGHKGIAGYLAEADLTTHLSSLAVNENFTATLASQNVIESPMQVVVSSAGTIDEELSMKGSLAAARKSAHAAALIQAAFRARPFRQRQLDKSSNDVLQVPYDLVALGSLKKVKKLSHFDDYLHSAALRIQQKYRGWKGRKEYLKIRNRIVKIQAHIRGHQVRKQYKKVVWSVSIVEKAILRWRRKGVGLRGFRVVKQNEKLQKSDEYEFLRMGQKQKSAGVEKALSRVQSMVRHPEARQQYMRMVSKFENLKVGGGQRNEVQKAEDSQS